MLYNKFINNFTKTPPVCKSKCHVIEFQNAIMCTYLK